MTTPTLESAWNVLAVFAEQDNWVYSESKQAWFWCGPEDTPPWETAMACLRDHGTALLGPAEEMVKALDPCPRCGEYGCPELHNQEGE